MNSYNYLDNISTLNLSTRSYNALIRENINTINDLLNCSKDDIIAIRNLGVKCFKEIFNIIDMLNAYKLENYTEDKMNEKYEPKYFIGSNGFKYVDIEIQELNIGVRAYNCLKSIGIDYYSQLISKLREELIAIPHMGKKTLLELEEVINTYKPQKYDGENKSIKKEVEDVGILLFTCLSKKININPKELLEVFEQEYLKYTSEGALTKNIDILKNKNFIKTLYLNKFISKIVNEYILCIIRENNYGCSEDDLFDKMPDYFKYTEILNEVLNDLMNTNNIDLVFDDRFVVLYKSFKNGAMNYLNEKEYDILIKRIQGKTLEEVGKTKGVVRERIRQIEAKAIKKLDYLKIKFKEDVYFDIFNRYLITKEEFIIAFNEEESYNYLVLRYGDSSEKNKLMKKTLENILDDKNIPVFFKRALEKAIYKDYVKIGTEYIQCNRNGISTYVLKNFGTNDLVFTDYCDIYQEIINDIGKSNDSKLTLMERGYENRIAASNIVLWKYGRKFRYYNIDSYDFTELLTTLNLKQYENIEYSALKFFKLYSELMKVYDIRDEYELHNLLKKICSNDEYPNINFKRMPNIEFGNANRDSQVMELLIALAPISNYEFAKEYENEYGVAANTVLANYMASFEQYFYNGVYKIDSPALPYIISNRLYQILTDDFYLLSSIREIYNVEFPQADKRLLNPFSLKSIGFKVYSNYVVKDSYSSASEYFSFLLTKNDITDLEKIPTKIKEIIAYTSQLYKLKSDYDIIEFIPNKTIHFRKLDEFGISKEMLKEYCNDVLSFVGEGKYFTLSSLRGEGFSHKLDELGFDDWFYTSILTEDKSNVSYQKIGGNKVMIKGKFNIRFEEFLEYIVYSQETLSIDTYDLSDILKQNFNINVNIWKIIEVVRNSSMYYDVISEKIFADYDIYYEGV